MVVDTFRSMLGESQTLFFIRVLAARNPSLAKVLYYTLMKADLPSRDTMLLQPKLYWNYPPLQKLMENPFVRDMMVE